MADIFKGTISIRDSERLRKSFFSHQDKKEIKVNKPRKKLYFLIPVILIVFAGIIVFLNFNIVFLPKDNLGFKDDFFNLMNAEVLGNIKSLNSQVTYKRNKGFIYLDIPFDNKNGFIMNFKESINVSGTEIKLLIKKVPEDINVYTILRDDKFYSNSLNPLKVDVINQNDKNSYMDVSIKIEEGLTPHINLNKIKHIRFVFYQKKVSLVNLLIKNIVLKNRR